ncbi:MAG TPA: TIGR00730 family Rossman fold protein [Candidatus Limnocylindrales bacterium]|jgi:hypothetical protein
MARLCVFCGSNAGRDLRHAELARTVGTRLAQRGIGVVFGGGRRGLMGTLADAALGAGGEVIGVIPRGLVDREAAHPDVTDLRLVDTLHERKALMADLSDGFLALPGGLGTLEELAEVLSWAQLGIHRKPVALLDPAGYWADLRSFLERAVVEGFLAREDLERLIVATDLEALLARLGL